MKACVIAVSTCNYREGKHPSGTDMAPGMSELTTSKKFPSGFIANALARKPE